MSATFAVAFTVFGKTSYVLKSEVVRPATEDTTDAAEDQVACLEARVPSMRTIALFCSSIHAAYASLQRKDKV